MLMVSPSLMETLVDIFRHTYALGLSDNDNFFNVLQNCPCGKYLDIVLPAFVGLDFYCKSEITSGIQGIN